MILEVMLDKKWYQNTGFVSSHLGPADILGADKKK
jgi:hypothetical protein